MLDRSSQDVETKSRASAKGVALRTVLPLIGILASIAAAAAGQFLLNEELMLQRLRSQPLFSLDPLLSAALPGVSLLVLSGVLFALASRWVAIPALEMPTTVFKSGKRWLIPLQFGAIAIGLGLVAFLAMNLLAGIYCPVFPLLLLGALLAFGIAFLLQDLRRGISLPGFPSRQSRFLELAGFAFLLAMIILFLALNLRNLTDPFYAAIGDEYAFFHSAQVVVAGMPVNLFGQNGVYGYHPLADTVYQAMVMNLFGVNPLGWKLSGVLIVILSLFPLYFLARHLFGIFAAAVAAIIVATSHYLFAYVHTGYNNIHALLPVLLTAWAAAVGISRQSPLLLYLAGVFAGLGFYTFFSARLAIVALMLSLLATGLRRRNLKLLFASSVGFLVAVFPLILVNKTNVITAMLSNSAVSEKLEGSTLVVEILKRALQSLFAFAYSTHRSHFITGSLLDPVSAALTAVAIVYALTRIKDWRYRFLLVWLIVALLVTGGFGWAVSNETRLMVLVPFFAVLAGSLLTRFIKVIVHYTLARKTAAILKAGILIALLAALLFTNLQRFWVTTPARFQLKPESLALREVLAQESAPTFDASPVVAITGAYALARPMFEAYLPGFPNPVLLDTREKLFAGKYVDSPLMVLSGMSLQEEQIIFSAIKAKSPEATFSEMKDQTGFTRIAAIRNPNPTQVDGLTQPSKPVGLRAVRKLGGLWAGDGRLNGPRGLVLDIEGNVYVADTKNHRVQMLAADGSQKRVFGGPPGSQAYLEAPVAIAVDNTGGIAVLDAGESQDVKRFAADGGYLGTIEHESHFSRPRALAFDSRGILYVADVGRVLKFSPEGTLLASLTSGFKGDMQLHLRERADIFLDNHDNLFIIDGATGIVSQLDAEGRLIIQWETLTPGKTATPQLAIAPDGSLIILIPEARQILRYSPTGQLLGNYYGESIIGERLEIPSDLAIDSRGYIYITDAGRHQIVRFAFYE